MSRVGEQPPDGIMRDLSDAPRGDDSWIHDHPANAAVDFARTHPEFEQEQPKWVFNESSLTENVIDWPDRWLRRKAA